jgi:hypothetical protein
MPYCRFAESVFGESRRRSAVARAKIRRGDHAFDCNCERGRIIRRCGVATSRQPGMSLAASGRPHAAPQTGFR